VTFPTTGALILVIGAWLFLFSPKFLYGAMVISIPFSATAVANLRWGGDEKSVAAWLFLGTLWVLRESISGLPVWRKRGWRLSRRARYALLAFLGAVVVSLCVPLLLNGTAWMPDPDPVGSQTVPIQFSLYNITQTVYLAFGVLLAILTAAENCRPSRLFYTLRLYVGSCTFVAAWGLVQLWCNVTGRVYPAYIFNTSASVSALGYKEALALGMGGLSRVSSAALEPSVLAEELLVALVVLLVCIRIGRPILSKKWDYAAVAVMGATLVGCTSTTAYAGVLIALVVAAAALARAHKPAKLYFVLAGVVSALAMLLTAIVPLVGQVASVALTDKLQTGSGFGRLHSVALAAQDFLRYPILGVGWHAVDCWDLVLLILANTGLLGIVTFGAFLLPVLRGLWAGAKEAQEAVALLAMVAVAVILAEGAGLSYAVGYIWLVFGLGAGAMAASQERHSSAPFRATTAPI
jgi:hypothetical protein